MNRSFVHSGREILITIISRTYTHSIHESNLLALTFCQALDVSVVHVSNNTNITRAIVARTGRQKSGHHLRKRPRTKTEPCHCAGVKIQLSHCAGIKTKPCHCAGIRTIPCHYAGIKTTPCHCAGVQNNSRCADIYLNQTIQLACTLLKKLLKIQFKSTIDYSFLF